MLDEQILDRAKSIMGAKTYSDVVNLALRELVRRKTFEQIDSYASSGVWEGDLAEMREDTRVSH